MFLQSLHLINKMQIGKQGKQYEWSFDPDEAKVALMVR